MARTTTQTRSSRSSSFDSFGNPRERGFVASSSARAFAPYVSGSAAPALDPLPRTRTRREEKQTPKIEVHPGGNPRIKTKAAPSAIPAAIQVFAAAILLFALIGFINITFTSAALASATEQDAVKTEISNAREEGKALEVELGSLSNPTSIKEKAAELGMAPATDVLQINLEEDIVKTDADGNLALAGSLKAAAGL